MKKAKKQGPKVHMKVRGLSINDELYNLAVEKAESEGRSFSYFARRAIKRDLESDNPITAPAQTAEPSGGKCDDISIKDVAARLNLSVSTVRKRQRNPRDPLFGARSRLGKKKPIQFTLSKIIELERSYG